MVHYQPETHHAITSYVHVDDCAAAIDWYCKYLDAEETLRLDMPGGAVMHAEVKIGDSNIMLSEANAEWGTSSPGELATYSLALYVPDCDAAVQRCVDGGATLLSPVEDQFWGDRSGRLRDPFGVHWSVMTHREALSDEEVQTRFQAMLKDFTAG